jgi:predicted phosphodiesterase
MMSNSLTIIHLSDLHIDPTQEGESRPVFESLCAKIESLRCERGVNFDLLIVSGDLVDRGAGDYVTVEKRLDEIMIASNLSRERVFVVPGNHDIDWEACVGPYEAVIEFLKTYPEKIETIDPEVKKCLLPGFSAYEDFASKFPLVQQKSFELPGFAQADLTISGIPIRLCGLNTAFTAGPGDRSKEDSQLKDRLVARRLLLEMLNAGERLKVVVSHYPLSWIHERQRQEIIQRLQRDGAIFLHGHVHEPEIDIRGVQRSAQLLTMGVGSLYGQKWQGRNHCQILELNADNSFPLLYEWFWFGDFGWRGFEPIEIAWGRWDYWRKQLGPPKLPLPDFTRKCGEAGLVNLANQRSNVERNNYYQQILDLAAEGSELVIVGRSLVDWSLLHDMIESAINDKRLQVKLALLDENCLPNKSIKVDNERNRTWIEMPIPSDWAMSDVPASMTRFRRIKVKPNTGSLRIYGLPFYVSRSFVAYTSKEDNERYCSEEIGMALKKDRRPFVEFKAISSDSCASSLERTYRGFLTEERLLLSDNGEHREERDTTQREKILAPKIRGLGLVDLSVGRERIDWPVVSKTISTTIDKTPRDGEIFIVGRSLIAWTDHLLYEKLAEAIVCKRIRCIFVIADPTDPDLESLVKKDYAVFDLKRVWEFFSTKIPPMIRSLAQERNLGEQDIGCFEVYGIPAYVPETFASYTGEDGIQYCSIEVGIGVAPNERTILYFQKIGEGDIYSSLNKIYRGIIQDRVPLLRVP